MSNPLPILLMTRPLAASRRFAEAIDGVRVILSPMIRIVERDPPGDLSAMDALVFTSANAVTALSGRMPGNGMRAYCVGPRTADAARAAGFDAVSADGDVNRLAAMLRRAGKDARMLYLRGNVVAADLPGLLGDDGPELEQHVIYDQEDLPLTQEAEDALFGATPVLLPMFSPRIAHRLGEMLPRHAPVLAAAISDSVADAFGQRKARLMIVAAAPNGEEMVTAVKALVAAGRQLEGRTSKG